MPQARKKSASKEDSKLTPKSKFERKKAEVIQRVHNTHISEIGYAVRHLSVMPAAEHTPEDVLKPEYWANCTKLINHKDKLCLDWADNTKYWELKVVDKGEGWVKVVPLTPKPLSYNSDQELPKLASDDFEVKFLNPHHRYGVRRKSDGTILTKDHVEKSSAQAWLAQHQQTISG